MHYYSFKLIKTLLTDEKNLVFFYLSNQKLHNDIVCYLAIDWQTTNQ